MVLKKLTTEQVERYERDGILAPLPVLSPDEAVRFRGGCEALEKALGGKPKATELNLTHLHFQWAYELVTHPSVLDAVEDVLGPNIVVWSSSIFAKHPHDPGYISFHQDGTYWGLDSTQVTTAWVALADSTIANGCMRVVPGSHRNEIHPHRETYAVSNMLSRGQEIQVEVDEADVLDVVLKAGEMSLHHVNIIHGSKANTSDSKRIGFAIRYITPAVRQIGDRLPVVLARGRDDFHHFDMMQGPPPRVSWDEAVAAHVATAQRHFHALTKTKAAG